MAKSFVSPLSKDEVNKIVEAAMGNDFYYTLFTVAKKTGRRLGEIYELKVKDIDFDARIMITKVLKRRQRVEKEAVLDDETSRILKHYVTRHKLRLEDPVFQKVSYRQIQRQIKAYAKEAGIDKNVSFHNFRHYFITELVRKGWTYDKIAKLTGHSSLSTLGIYDHTVASDLKSEAQEAIRDL